MNKRGQFYIVAAVIIAAVVVSLAVVQNSANSKAEPSRFYDLGGELKIEAARVVDYGVYYDKDIPVLMSTFSELVAVNILGKYPDMGFVFVFGNTSELHVENYGKNESSFKIGDSGGSVQGGGAEYGSNIELRFGDASFTRTVDQDLMHYKKNAWKAKINNPQKEANIEVNINKQKYAFAVKENQQFFMILLKNEGEDEYVGIE